MEVIPIGTRVKVGFGEIDAVVTAVNVRMTGVEYEVAWWNGRERYCCWVSACEVETDGPVATSRIGFLAPATNGH